MKSSKVGLPSTSAMRRFKSASASARPVSIREISISLRPTASARWSCVMPFSTRAAFNLLFAAIFDFSLRRRTISPRHKAWAEKVVPAAEKSFPGKKNPRRVSFADQRSDFWRLIFPAHPGGRFISETSGFSRSPGPVFTTHRRQPKILLQMIAKCG